MDGLGSALVSSFSGWTGPTTHEVRPRREDGDQNRQGIGWGRGGCHGNAEGSLSAAAATYRHTERGSLTIHTQDGDVVRLRFRMDERANLTAVHADGETGETSALQISAGSRTKFSVSVQGELDAEELAAIEDTIAQAGALAEDFFDGDLGAAFSAAQDLGFDANELASVSLRLKSTERFTYAGQNLTYGPPALKPVEAPEVAPLPALEAPADVDVAPDTALVPVVEDGSEAPDVSEPPKETAEPEAAEAPAPDPIEQVTNFLAKLRSTYSVDASGWSSGVAVLSMSLKLKIFSSALVTAADSQGTPEAVPPIVPETVDAIALQETPLDAVA